MKPQDAYLATKTFPSLGSRRALNLWKSGVKNPHEVAFMTDDSLLELPGIDKVALAEIRLTYPAQTWTKAMDKQYKALLTEVSMTDKDEEPDKN